MMNRCKRVQTGLQRARDFSFEIGLKGVVFWSLLAFGGSCTVAKTEIDPSGSGSSVGAVRTSVQYIKSLYTGFPTTIDSNLELMVVVTANDRYGTFPYTLYLQDQTGGIALKAGAKDLFLEYPIGTSLLLHCQGLVLGSYGAEISLGATAQESNYQNEPIDDHQLPLRLKARGQLIEPLPMLRSMGELTPKQVGSFIALDGVQFIEPELGMPWSEPEADTDRHLVDLVADTLIVRTRPQANFSSQLIPHNSGYVEGILGCFNHQYQLRVIYRGGVVMESPRFQPFTRSIEQRFQRYSL